MCEKCTIEVDLQHLAYDSYIVHYALKAMRFDVKLLTVSPTTENPLLFSFTISPTSYPVCLAILSVNFGMECQHTYNA